MWKFIGSVILNVPNKYPILLIITSRASLVFPFSSLSSPWFSDYFWRMHQREKEFRKYKTLENIEKLSRKSLCADTKNDVVERTIVARCRLRTYWYCQKCFVCVEIFKIPDLDPPWTLRFCTIFSSGTFKISIFPRLPIVLQPHNAENMHPLSMYE